MGGHNGDHGNYNYGSEGSLNGLLAVWDSWLQYFFSISSNTTSLLLFFDERDFNASNVKRLADSNIQRSRKEYLDHILINNMVSDNNSFKMNHFSVFIFSFYFIIRVLSQWTAFIFEIEHIIDSKVAHSLLRCTSAQLCVLYTCKAAAMS